MIKVDHVYQFGTFELGTEGLVSGWAVPEEAHAWNDGQETIFVCMTERRLGASVIEVTGEPFFCVGVAEQDVWLHVNGFSVGHWRLTEARSYVLKSTIEPEQIFQRGEGSFLKCVWYFPGAIKPSVRGISSDSRELAFCFRSIAILRH